MQQKKSTHRKKIDPTSPSQVSVNRRASFDYFILETFEAGLVLQGSEVKSLRNRRCQLKNSYVVFKKEEAYIQNLYISPYQPASSRNHNPERRRKLLLNRRELKKISGSIHQKGLSCIPLKLYFKRRKAKIELGLVKGKKKWDKRETVKRKQMDRSAEKALKRER